MPGESKSSPREIQNYLGGISGPLLDRIDLHVEVPSVKFRKMSAERTDEAFAAIRARVVAARQRQQECYRGRKNVASNAGLGLSPHYLHKPFCIRAGGLPGGGAGEVVSNLELRITICKSQIDRERREIPPCFGPALKLRRGCFRGKGLQKWQQRVHFLPIPPDKGAQAAHFDRTAGTIQ